MYSDDCVAHRIAMQVADFGSSNKAAYRGAVGCVLETFSLFTTLCTVPHQPKYLHVVSKHKEQDEVGCV